MQVKDQIMYHFHNNRVYNDIWVPGNEIIVDDNFEASYLNVLKYYSTAVKTVSGGKRAFNYVIDDYIGREQDKETLIDLLKEASYIIYGANIFKRELALEKVRKLKYPDLPSRKHSIWLCDEKGLEFWNSQISYNDGIKTDLYKLLVTGNIFKSSDEFIPSNTEYFETNLEEAEKYWNPSFTGSVDETRVEYLFQGRAKILAKVDIKAK